MVDKDRIKGSAEQAKGKVKEAVGNLGSLKAGLLELEHHEYGSEYAGDRTFEKDVDDIINELAKTVHAIQEYQQAVNLVARGQEDNLGWTITLKD